MKHRVALNPGWQFDGREVPHLVVPPPGPRAQGYLERDETFVSPSYTRVYPLVVARGSGAVIEDVDSNLYLDFTAGIAVNSTGHCHPHVVAAIRDQAERLLHMSGTDFYYAPQVDLAERLATAVGPGRRVFFTNSGTESLEAALKLARHHTRRSRILSFFGSFHGRTYGGMSLSGSKLVHRRGFGPLVPDIHHVLYPQAGEDGAACVANIESTVLKRTAPPEEVAAIFVEPIQGEGGYRVPSPTFLPALRKLCDKHGILLVADEVQSGMGRTGTMFACEHFGVQPDIYCLAKGIASGMPLGAIVSKAEIMDWPPGSHASTFGGNPVSCRAALATMDLLEAGYMRNADEMGDRLRRGLRDLGKRHREMGDVRGLGLMTAMDLPTDRRRNEVVQEAFVRGLLLLGCGESAIRFCPPLCITAAQVDRCLEILDAVLAF